MLAMIGALLAAAELSPPVGQALGVQANVARASPAFIVIGRPAPTDSNELNRSGDGLFYVDAMVNGAPVRFLVDTGASVVVLRSDDAQRAGIMVDAREFSENAETANGQAAMARVTLDEVMVGSVRSEALSAAVVRDGLSVSLLGQNWLSQLASLTISGDRMIFKAQ